MAFSILVLAALAIMSHLATAAPGAQYVSGGCTQAGEKFADAEDMCWYHECLESTDGGFYTIPRRCALGSKVDYTFTFGLHNPCTVSFDTVYGYECARQQASNDAPPKCASDGSVQCFNGGTLTYEESHCWCLCDIEWEGDFDCSKPTGYYDAIADSSVNGNNICIDGEPEEDHCYNAGGCENGGTCWNQCRGFWCECPANDLVTYIGKRCEY